MPPAPLSSVRLTPTDSAVAAIEFFCSVIRRTAPRLKSSLQVFGHERFGKFLLARSLSYWGHYPAGVAVRK